MLIKFELSKLEIIYLKLLPLGPFVINSGKKHPVHVLVAVIDEIFRWYRMLIVVFENILGDLLEFRSEIIHKVF